MIFIFYSSGKKIFRSKLNPKASIPWKWAYIISDNYFTLSESPESSKIESSLRETSLRQRWYSKKMFPWRFPPSERVSSESRFVQYCVHFQNPTSSFSLPFLLKILQRPYFSSSFIFWIFHYLLFHKVLPPNFFLSHKFSHLKFLSLSLSLSLSLFHSP